jgi:hypothetical protein
MTASTWTQESIHLIKTRQSSIEQLGLLVQGLSGLMREERSKYKEDVARILQVEPSGICLGSSPCETSPTGECIYESAIGGAGGCLICQKSQTT